MKTIPCLLVAMTSLWITASSIGSASAAGRKGKVYRHVVLFSFSEEATEKQVKEVETAFAALPDKISSIVDYEWGTNVSPEGLADGFTHCFFVTFKNKAGLEEYLPHKAHQQFVELVKPLLAKVLVIDYLTE